MKILKPNSITLKLRKNTEKILFKKMGQSRRDRLLINLMQVLKKEA